MGVNCASTAGISSMLTCKFENTKPIQVPQLRNGEQALQSPSSLCSCEWLLVFSAIISSSQLSSEQQGTAEREKTYNDKMKQSVFIVANITNICGWYENVEECKADSHKAICNVFFDLHWKFYIEPNCLEDTLIQGIVAFYFKTFP